MVRIANWVAEKALCLRGWELVSLQDLEQLHRPLPTGPLLSRLEAFLCRWMAQD
jgi:hypothetical protein